MYDQHTLTPVGLAVSAKPKYVTPKVMFGCCCLYCCMWIMTAVYTVYNNDQSLSHVTLLVSLLFLSFLIP